jgi:superfamily I DNA/RNA helicase
VTRRASFSFQKGPFAGLAAAIAYFLAWLRKSAQSRTTSGGQGLLGEDDDDMHEAGCRRKNFTKGNGAGQLKMSVEEELKAKYEAEKKRRNLVDFDDMVPCALTLLRRDVLVRQRLQSRFQYILVDECQDVSEGQFALLEAMASGISSPSITACGDPDQSIYAFLNGCARNNFDEFMSTWPTSVLIKLRKNFRSDQMIVRAAAAVIAKNPETPTSTAKHSWTDNQDGLPISICSFSSVEREVNWVCDQVAQCKSDGVPLRQMAILFRQRSHGKSLVERESLSLLLLRPSLPPVLDLSLHLSLHRHLEL